MSIVCFELLQSNYNHPPPSLRNHMCVPQAKFLQAPLFSSVTNLLKTTKQSDAGGQTLNLQGQKINLTVKITKK